MGLGRRSHRETFLSFAPPWLGDEEIDEVVATLRSGWLTTGPRTKRFEEGFAAYVGAPAALALNSGTAAMHVALAALGVGPGDAVVTTPLTFVSGIHVIEQVGARPLLADVDAETLNLDLDQTDKVIQAARADGVQVRGIALRPSRAIERARVWGPHGIDRDAWNR